MRTIQAAFADGCSLDDKSLIYDPKKNKKGVRCTTQEMRVNIYGKDPKTGFARRPIDTGRRAVRPQRAQRGQDHGRGLPAGQREGRRQRPGRRVLLEAHRGRCGGDQARSTLRDCSTRSRISMAVPMLHYRSYTDDTTPAGDIHDRHRDLTIRARLEKATGSSANQVIWVADWARGERGTAATVNLALRAALDTMTKWLDAMAADPAPLSPGKVVKTKPRRCGGRLLDAGRQARERGCELGS